MELTPDSNEIVIKIKCEFPEKEQKESNQESSEITKNKLLTVEQLADYLNVPKTWIYDRTHRNAIPHYKIGRYLRFEPKQIDEWLKAIHKTVD